MPEYILGIDVSKLKFDVALLVNNKYKTKNAMCNFSGGLR